MFTKGSLTLAGLAFFVAGWGATFAVGNLVHATVGTGIAGAAAITAIFTP